MSQVSLAVTTRELEHSKSNAKEKQIALRSPSLDIESTVRGLTSARRAHLTLGGFITLDVADSGAIWLAHNGKHVEAFEALFSLLSTRPDHEMQFTCTLEPLPS